MARDYAKKNKSRRRPTKKRKAAPGWMWLTAGFCLALVVVGLYYLNQHHLPLRATAKSSVNTNKKVAQAEASKPALTFDFYTMLPERSVQNQSSNTPSMGAPVQAAVPDQQYVLQVASVKQYTAADRLKAELTLLGFNVAIQASKVGKTTWNRVNVGPFKTIGDASAAQKQLRQNNIDSMLVKIPG